MKRIFLTISVITFILNPGTARAGAYGTELPFVLGTSARATSLGMAATGLPGDASSQYFNPALPAKIERKQATFFRTVLFDSKSLYHSVSYCNPFTYSGVLAVSIMRLDVGGIEQRDASNLLLSPNLKSSQTRMLIGYSRSIHPSILLGANLKLDYQSFAGYSATGIGVDIGFLSSQYRGPDKIIRSIHEGFTILNLVEPTMKLAYEKVPDPMQLAVGVSVLGGYGDFDFQSSLDLVNPRFSPFSLRFGQEITYMSLLSIRLGFNGTSPTYGFGAGYKNIQLDYAYRTEDLGSNHSISLSFAFGSSVKEIKEARRLELENDMNEELNRKLKDWEHNQVYESMRRADSLYAKGDFKSAKRYYEMALLWQPDLDRARIQLDKCLYEELLRSGKEHFQAGEYGQALLSFREAITYTGQDSALQELITTCKTRINEARNNTELANKLLNNAVELYADRRFPEALELFEEILQIMPGNELAEEYRDKSTIKIREIKNEYIKKAKVLAAGGNYTEAITLLNKAMPYDVESHDILGLIDEIEKQSSLHERTTPAPKIRKKGPQTTDKPALSRLELDNLEIEYKKGLEYFEKGKFAKAVIYLSNVWMKVPEFHKVKSILTKAYLFLGMNLYTDEKYSEAIEMWEKALRIDPSNAKAKRYLLKTKEEMRTLSRVNNG